MAAININDRFWYFGRGREVVIVLCLLTGPAGGVTVGEPSSGRLGAVGSGGRAVGRSGF